MALSGKASKSHPMVEREWGTYPCSYWKRETDAKRHKDLADPYRTVRCRQQQWKDYAERFE